MKIYTKKGDTGETSLLGGTRVPKYDLRIEAYGTVDELNSVLGMISDQEALSEYLPLLREIQNKLFTIGSILANDPEHSHFKLPEVKVEDIERLELSMDEMEATLPELKNFVLPGGHPANSLAHLGRCVCRRAERRTVELAAQAPVPALVITYLNRLSDWLFMLARTASLRTGAEEVVWK